MGFTYKKSVYSIMFSLPDMGQKDLLTVISLVSCTEAVHIGTDNTLTCTDDLTRLINARE